MGPAPCTAVRAQGWFARRRLRSAAGLVRAHVVERFAAAKARTRAATGWSRNLAPGSHPGLPRGPAAHLVRVDGVASATLSQTVAAWLTISSRLHYLRLTPPSHRTGRVRSLHGAHWASPVTAAAAALPPADGTRHGRGPAGSGVATHPCPAPAGHATWLPALTSVSYVGQLRTRSEWMVSLAPRSRGQSRHSR